MVSGAGLRLGGQVQALPSSLVYAKDYDGVFY